MVSHRHEAGRHVGFIPKCPVEATMSEAEDETLEDPPPQEEATPQDLKLVIVKPKEI